MVRRLQLDIDTKSDRVPIVAAAKAVDELADSFDDAGKDAAQLDRRLETTGRKVKELAREIARASDEVERADLEKAFGDESRTLAKLRRIRSAIDEVGDEARETSREVAEISVGAGARATGAVSGLFSRSIGSPLTVTLVGAAVAASPLIAGAIGGAVAAGVGTGVVAAGLVGAFQDAAVKTSAKQLGSEIKNDFLAAGSAFEEPALKGLAKVRNFWRTELRGQMQGLIGDASKLVDPMVEGAIGFTRELTPGIRRLVREGGPVFDVLKNDLPQVGRSLTELFDQFSGRSEKTADALHDVLIFTTATVGTTGQLLGYLTDIYDIWRRFVSPIHFFADEDKLAGPDQVSYLKSINDETRLLSEQGQTAFHGITTGSADARIEVQKLNAAFRDAFGILADLDAANIDFKLGLLDLKKEIKDNGKAFDEKTAAGLRNRDAVLKQIEIAARVRDAEIEAAGGTEDAVRRANAAFQAKVGQIRAVAVAAGASGRALDAFLAKYVNLARAPNITKKVFFISDTSKYHPPRVAAGQYVAFGSGGPVTGPMRGKDSVPALLAPGEFVLNQKMVGELGGTKALEDLRTGGSYREWPKPSGYMSMPPRAGGGGSARLRVEYVASGDRILDEIIRGIRLTVVNDGGGDVQLALGRPTGR